MKTIQELQHDAISCVDCSDPGVRRLAIIADNMARYLADLEQRVSKFEKRFGESDFEKQCKQLRKALVTARSLIIQHHECGVMQHAGIICPVCSKDGERALNSIYTALNDTA